MNKKILSSLLMVVLAAVWGGSFVAQTKGGNLIGPFSFGFVRFLIAGISIMPIAILSPKIKKSNSTDTENGKKPLFRGGMICGFFLACTAALQQMGLFMGTPSGKAGFLTSCYIVFVPVLATFFKKKCDANVWVAVGIALVGLYLLCIKDGFSFQASDGIVLLCSIMIASRIIATDRFVNRVNTSQLACVQFFTASVILGVLTIIFEVEHSSGGIAEWWSILNQKAVWGALMYSGLLAGTIAFTLQIVIQKNINPTLASLLMSLESVFSVISGWLILGDALSARELIGCGVIFAALVLAQLDFKSKKEKA